MGTSTRFLWPATCKIQFFSQNIDLLSVHIKSTYFIVPYVVIIWVVLSFVAITHHELTVSSKGWHKNVCAFFCFNVCLVGLVTSLSSFVIVISFRTVSSFDYHHIKFGDKMVDYLLKSDNDSKRENHVKMNRIDEDVANYIVIDFEFYANKYVQWNLIATHKLCIGFFQSNIKMHWGHYRFLPLSMENFLIRHFDCSCSMIHSMCIVEFDIYTFEVRCANTLERDCDQIVNTLLERV